MTLFRRKAKAPIPSARLNAAFTKGKEAAKQGLSVGMCPYSGWKYLEERKQWLDGYESLKGNRND